MRRSAFARGAIVAVLCTFAAAQAVTAQNIYGSLVGNVTDSSGAYSIPNIPSGTYTVTVTVPGFQTFTATNITVTNRDVRVDARLSLGALEREWRFGARFGF